MKDTKEIKPNLKQVGTELKGLFAAAAVAMNECFYPKSGNRLLGVSEESSLIGAAEHVDLEKTNIGRYLPIYFAYAYDGRLIPGYEDEIQQYGENIEKLVDFVQMFPTDGSYFDLCLDVVGIDPDDDTGYLDDMLGRLKARANLDNGDSLALGEIAILADMNERSVRNALTSDGENRLTLNAKGTVDNDVAQRWLKARRGFKATERRNFPESLSECPDELDALEIPPFVANRIGKRFGKNMFDSVALSTASSPDVDGAYVEYPEILLRAAKIAWLPPEAIQGAMQQPLRIKPEECMGLAKAIAVDPVWFTMQVMRALYPTQMDMLLNPNHYSLANDDVVLEGKSVDVILTEAMIKHGYLDLPAHAKPLFPKDCFGSRQEGDAGASVTLRYGNQEIQTDIRVKSEQTISPRKRFTAWFQKELSAAPGDRIRFSQVTDRLFELTHLPK